MQEYKKLKLHFREIYRKMLLDGYSNITKEDEVLVEKLVDKVMDLLDAIIKGKIGDVNSLFEEYAKK